MVLRRFLVKFVWAALALSAAVPPVLAADNVVQVPTVVEQLPHPAKGEFPAMVLSESVSRGQQAVDLLGSRLAAVAAWYGKSATEFAQMMRTDPLLRLDRQGRLFVEETINFAAYSAAEDSVLDGTLLPLDQTFALHSRPGARRTIYLNFKGATLQGTAWNNGGGAITALPFDLDGIPYSFSSAELQRIQYIWQRVAEDYAPFDVDVTTEAPPPEALSRASASDQVFGTTVLITKSTGVYSCSCGGVAYIGIFDDTRDTYKPALVFYNHLASGGEKAVAEAISHEAGHNLGLGHDGTPGSAYYSGQGSGATAWAPIMGTAYTRALSQWSQGEYANASNRQDDYAVMQATGLPLRADDHGNTAATATLLAATVTGGVAGFAAQGVIERPGDVDVFAFSAAAGAVTLQLTPATRSPNLDAAIELRNAAGVLLASANPAEAVGAAISFTLPAAGTYYVSVTGVGKGDPLTTGYSNYGSLGNYLLTVNALAVVAQAPVAVLSATPASGPAPLTVSFSGAASSDADGSVVAYEWTFGDGSSATGASTSHRYASAGTYTALLKVTDSQGLSSTKSVTITATAAAAPGKMRVASIWMGLSTASGYGFGNATVTVVDGAGNRVAGATVTGTWSGIVSGFGSRATASNGSVSFTSPATRQTGTMVFTVTGISHPNFSYDARLNAETSDRITR